MLARWHAEGTLVHYTGTLTLPSCFICRCCRGHRSGPLLWLASHDRFFNEAVSVARFPRL